MKKQIKLGVSVRVVGYHDAAWLHPESSPNAGMTLKHYISVAQKAENAKFDMIFLADFVGVHAQSVPYGAYFRKQGIGGFEPLTLLSALSAVTERIGLTSTASTTYNAPYHIARKFASLDHLSEGRAGWNVVTSYSVEEARNFGLESPPDYDTRYDRAEEFVDVVRGLWDSWEKDAFVRDKQSGLFFDPSRLNVLDHKGKFFSVRGPLDIPRSPQGHPLIIEAGASEPGQELAARTADVVYVAAQTIEESQAFYSSVKSRMQKYGRQEDELKIMPGLMAIVGRTQEEAQEKFDRLQDLLDPIVGLSRLAPMWGDLSGYDLDGPVPALENPTIRSRAKVLADLASRENLSIRGLYKAAAATGGHRLLIGTADYIVDEMQKWFEGGAADGFNILPAYLPGSLDDFIELVVPELRRRGLFRSEYEGKTLRENLGVKVFSGEP